MAVEGGGGGGEGLLAISEKNILQNDFQGKNICTKKKISWRIMLGKNLHRYMTGKILNQTKSPTPSPPTSSKVKWSTGSGKKQDGGCL